MTDRINKDELIKRVAVTTGHNKALVAEIVDTTFEEIYQAFKREEKVTIRNFGSFYIDVRRSGTVFKFNPGPAAEGVVRLVIQLSRRVVGDDGNSRYKLE